MTNYGQYWWVGLLMTVFTVGVPALTSRFGPKGDRENKLIDQIQEELTATRAEAAEYRKTSTEEIAAMRKDFDAMKAEMARLVSRDMIWGWHVDRQNQLIITLNGTPLDLPEQLKGKVQ